VNLLEGEDMEGEEEVEGVILKGVELWIPLNINVEFIKEVVM
jgi:hypothetical protein